MHATSKDAADEVLVSCIENGPLSVLEVAEVELGVCANVDLMEQIQAIGNQRIGAVACKDQGRPFVIVDDGKADRNVCLFGVLCFD